MNRIAVAKELVAVAKSLTAAWGLAEPLEVRVSRTRDLLADGDFDRDAFEKAVMKIVRRYGFDVRPTQGMKYGGQWTWTWNLPEDAERFLANMKADIKRLPQWSKLSEYGTIIEIGQN